MKRQRECLFPIWRLHRNSLFEQGEDCHGKDVDDRWDDGLDFAPNRIRCVPVFINVYFMAMVALGIVTKIVSMWFTHGMERRVDMGPLGHMGAGHERYTNGALLGLRDIPTRFLRVLAWILRVLVVVWTLGYIGAIYMAFSTHFPEPDCDLCQFDPHGKSPLFWAAFVLAIIVTLVPGLISIMVARVDPRQVEATGRFDLRRIKMGLRWIFQDRPMRKDAVAAALRQLCRWLILIGILDAIVIASLMALQ
jgi:hypothetical protein